MGMFSISGVDIVNPSSDQRFALGSVALSTDGQEWVYVKAGSSGITGAGYVVILSTAWVADMVSTSNDARGWLVGVANSAFTANYYGWVQRSGYANVQVLASAAANARLNTTATAGALDDDGTSTTFQIDGMVLSAARAASQGNAAAVLNWPTVGAVI